MHRSDLYSMTVQVMLVNFTSLMSSDDFSSEISVFQIYVQEYDQGVKQYIDPDNA